MVLKDLLLIWTGIKSLFNKDVQYLLEKCENLESLYETRCKEFAEDRRKFHKEYKDYLKYVEEVDTEYQYKYRALSDIRSELFECKCELNILKSTDKGELLKQLKNKEDKIEFLESTLKIADDKTKEYKDFIESLPDSYKCAYELYVKNKGNVL